MNFSFQEKDKDELVKIRGYLVTTFAYNKVSYAALNGTASVHCAFNNTSHLITVNLLT